MPILQIRPHMELTAMQRPRIYSCSVPHSCHNNPVGKQEAAKQNVGPKNNTLSIESPNSKV
jgi:hypothetical protein